MFLRYIAHEIRNPLNIISLGLQVLNKDLDSLNSFATSILTFHSNDEDQEKVKLVVSAINDFLRDCTTTTSQIEISTSVAVDILNEMLLYEKIESKSIKLDLNRHSPTALVEESIKTHSLQAKEAGIELSLNCTSTPSLVDSPPSIMGDKFKLTQVLHTLLSNAFKFTSRGGRVEVGLDLVAACDRTSFSPKARLIDSNWTLSHPSFSPPASTPTTTSLLSKYCPLFTYPSISSGSFMYSPIYPVEKAEMDQVLIHVRDTGQGISHDDLCSIFRGGVDFNPSKQSGGKGTGLGLLISKNILELHGGSLSVFSEGCGKGSTFTISLPLMHAQKSSTSHSLSLPSDSFYNQMQKMKETSPTYSPTFDVPPILDSIVISPPIEPGTEHIQRPLHQLMSLSLQPSFSMPTIKHSSFNNLLPPSTPPANLPPPPLLPLPLPNSIVPSYSFRSNSSRLNLRDSLKNLITLHVLVVDDSLLNRKLTCKLLQNVTTYNTSTSSLSTSEKSASSSSRSSVPTSLSLICICFQAENGKIAVEMVETSLRMKNKSKESKEWVLSELVPDDPLAHMENGTHIETPLFVNLSSSQPNSDDGSHSLLPFDAILMDYQMPHMNGVEAIRAIRTLGFSGLILGLTGNAVQSDLDSMVEAGANAVLTKPVDLPKLQSYLGSVAEGKLKIK